MLCRGSEKCQFRHIFTMPYIILVGTRVEVHFAPAELKARKLYPIIVCIASIFCNYFLIPFYYAGPG